MKDEILQKAIDYCGGQTELAKRVGKSQSAISRWEKVPAEYVIAVEKATDGTIPRQILRPDIYPPEEFKQTGHS